MNNNLKLWREFYEMLGVEDPENDKASIDELGVESVWCDMDCI